MMVFFELAFQQTQIGAIDFVDLVPPNGLGQGRGLPPLVQDVRESFARTVLALAKQGRPFTDAFHPLSQVIWTLRIWPAFKSAVTRAALGALQ